MPKTKSDLNAYNNSHLAMFVAGISKDVKEGFVGFRQTIDKSLVPFCNSIGNKIHSGDSAAILVDFDKTLCIFHFKVFGRITDTINVKHIVWMMTFDYKAVVEVGWR